MQADRIRESEFVDITFEVIDRFLERRGWRQNGAFCWQDSTGRLKGTLHWTNALEVQLDRDHKAAADEMTRAFAGAAR